MEKTITAAVKSLVECISVQIVTGWETIALDVAEQISA